jgi:hypothetical protein
MIVTKGGPGDIGVVVEAEKDSMREPEDVRRHHQDEGTILSVPRAELIDPKDTAAGLDPETAPWLAQDGEMMTATQRPRTAIERAHRAEKGGLGQGLCLGIDPGDVLVPLRRQAEDRIAQRDDENERKGNVRRRKRRKRRWFRSTLVPTDTNETPQQRKSKGASSANWGKYGVITESE